MHRSLGQPPTDIDAVQPRRHGPGGRSSGARSTLRELWRFKDYGRPERRSLVLGVLMNGGRVAAGLAAPWPLALVINDLLQGKAGQDAGSCTPSPGGSAVRRWRCCWSRRSPCW